VLLISSVECRGDCGFFLSGSALTIKQPSRISEFVQELVREEPRVRSEATERLNRLNRYDRERLP
jgi:hypothetical protein